MHDDTTSTIQSDMVFLIIAIFAIVIAIMPAFGFINIPEIKQENKNKTGAASADNALEVRYDYEEGNLYVMGVLLEDRELLVSKLDECSGEYSQIRFLASKTAPWSEILPVLRNLKVANLPIKCVHIIKQEVP